MSRASRTSLRTLQTDQCEAFRQRFEDGDVGDAQWGHHHLQVCGLSGGVEGQTLRKTGRGYQHMKKKNRSRAVSQSDVLFTSVLMTVACAAGRSLRIFSTSIFTRSAASLNAGGESDAGLMGADWTKTTNRKQWSRAVAGGKMNGGSILSGSNI